MTGILLLTRRLCARGEVPWSHSGYYIFQLFFGHHFLNFFDLLGQCDNFQIEGQKEY